MTDSVRQTISFGDDAVRFNFRAAAVIIDHGRVLLHRADYEDFWSLPGGRVEMLEAARDGLRREMMEELGEEMKIGRLVWVGENFFEFQESDFHELGMYFEASLAASSALRQHTEEWYAEEDNGVKIVFRWFDLDAVPEMPVVPGFLREGLGALPAGTEHVMYRDATRWGEGTGR